MVERLKTGIPGLDGLLNGGVPKGSVTLVTGGAGTGKTIFCCQFILEGIKNGEKCIYLTLEEEPEEIRADAKEFGWNFESYEKKKKLSIHYMNPLEGHGFETRIEDMVDHMKASRIVLDSTSVLGMYSSTDAKVRERLYSLIRILRRSHVTALLTAEIPEQDKGSLSRFGVEEFVSDGVIVMYYLSIGSGLYRNIEIKKMRRTNQKKGTFPMHITNKGIKVFETEEEFMKVR